MPTFRAYYLGNNRYELEIDLIDGRLTLDLNRNELFGLHEETCAQCEEDCNCFIRGEEESLSGAHS